MPSKKIAKTAASDQAPAGQDRAAPPAAATTEPICVAIIDLGRARALPLAPQDHASAPDDLRVEPGTIEQFADEDGTTMRVVNVGGVAHKAPAPVIDQQPETEGA